MSYVVKYKHSIILFLWYTNLKSNFGLFSSNVFQSFIFDGYFIPFQLYLLTKGLIFDALCASLLISLSFYATVAAHWKHFIFEFCCFFLFYPVWRINIWSSTFKNSSPDIYKTTVGLNRKKDRSLIDVSKLIWWLERSDSKSSLTTIFAISYGISSILSLLECITRSSSTSLEEIKLAAILNSIFHVSAFWRLIVISLKYGLILSKYSITDMFLFLSPLLSYSK